MTAVAGFTESLRELPLLDDAQRAELTGELQGRFPEQRALAVELIRRGWLTPFQVNMLAQGRGRQLVLGGYVLVERIAEGGMGQVFKARRAKPPAAVVAVKVIRPERLCSPDAVRRFEREAKAAAMLRHPNIVRVFEVGQAGDTPFLAMELIDGTDLHHMVLNHGPLPIHRACSYVRQAALALQHAFERQMVHRDVKPANLMVTAKGDQLKMLDLGLARLTAPLAAECAGTSSAAALSMGRLTQEGTVLGTPDFLAPEQALQPHLADIRADIYSLGCTLYYLLTARPPFPGGTLAQKLLWHQQAEPVPPASLRPDLPPGLSSLLRRMMAKRPQERYPTPQEVANLLESLTVETPAESAVMVASLVEPPPIPLSPLASHDSVVQLSPLPLREGGEGSRVRGSGEYATHSDTPRPYLTPPEQTAVDLRLSAQDKPPRRFGWSKKDDWLWTAVTAGSAVAAALIVLLLWHFFRDKDRDDLAGGPPAGGEVRPPPNPRPPADRPEPREAGIKPAPLMADREERPLPSAVGDICVGGGGRFLILHLPRDRKLAVFDVNEAKIVKYLPVPDDNVKLAAGMDVLIVALPSSNVLQRWSLTTFEREATVPCPVNGVVHGVAMGSASRGPLVVCSGAGDRFGRNEITLLDPQNFKESDAVPRDRGGPNAGFDPRVVPVRVSADGRVVVGVGGGGWVLEGKTYKSYPLPAATIPGPDGRTLYSPGQLFSSEGKPLGQPIGGHGRMVWYLPALHGPLYFSLNETAKEGRPDRATLRFSVHLPGDTRPLVSLPFLESLDTLTDWRGGVPPFVRHVYLIPDAKLLVILPDGNDRLVLHRFDLDELLAKANVDYLFVQSRPPTVGVRGQPFDYLLAVRSKRGGVKVKLDDGPRGMNLTPEGRLSWAVPKDFADTEVNVILTVSDASGQEVLHTFRLAVKDKADAPRLPVEPAKPPVQPPKPPVEPPKAPIGPPILPIPGKPPPPVGDLKPAPLKVDREERALPSSVDDACVGGGGRFFILSLPKDRKLAIFDVNEAKIVKYLPVADGNVKIAAGRDKLFVVSSETGIIQRFSLATFEKEVTAQLAVNGTVKAICMGSAAVGPLLVYYQRGVQGPVTFLDPVTLKEVHCEGINVHLGGAEHFRASPDGTVFGGWPTSHSQSMTSIVLTGKSARVHRGEMAGIVVPAADNTLMTGGGLYTAECKSLGSDKAEPRYRLRVPSQTGRFYLTCPGGGGAQINTGVMDAGKPVTLYLMGDSRPIATLNDVELPASNEAWTGSDFTQDKRVLFVPEAKLIAIIPRSNDRLVLHRLDIDAALEKVGIDFLFVVSRPPSVANKGTRVVYAPQVKSKKGGVKFKLESGPDGMRVTADGKLAWDVPRDFADTEVAVILTVSDASGQEVFHNFRIAVRDRADGGP